MASKIEEMAAEAEVTVEFADQHERVLFAEAAIGLDCRDFIESQVGRRVLGAAHQDYEDLKEQIVAIDPVSEQNIAQIRVLQAKKEGVICGVRWLLEAVVAGMEAERALAEDKEASSV